MPTTTAVAAVADHRERLADRLRAADDLDRVVDSAAGQRADIAHRTSSAAARRRPSRRGCARSSSFAGSRSTATIREAPASEPRTTTCSADPAAADHGDGVADADTGPRCARRRPPSRRRSRPAPPATAADRRAAARPSRGVDHAALGEARQVEEVLDVGPSAGAAGCVPSSSSPAALLARRGLAQVRLPGEALRQLPHAGTKQNATRSPGATAVTPAPTASTTPAPSCPSTIGQRSAPRWPSARCRSEWQTPAAATRTSTSPARGGSSADVLDPHRLAHARASTAARTDRLAHATRCGSRASRSGSTPRPGPAGGAIVPSAAISTGAGSSQSRRSADHAGGSNGTST